MRGAVLTCLAVCVTLVALLSPALGQEAGPVLIKEVISRESTIHVGGGQTPDIKEVVSREQALFIENGPANPYAQVVSRQVSLAVASTAVPTPIADLVLTVSPTGETVTLDWSAYNQWIVRDIARFNIYVSDSGPINSVTGLTPFLSVPGETTVITLTGLAAFTDHFFAVVPVDVLGGFDPIVMYSAAYVLSPEAVSREVSLYIGGEPTPPYAQAISRQVSLVVVSPAPPAPIVDLEITVSPSGDTVTLDWSSYNQWGVRDIDHFAIYLSDSGPFSTLVGLTPFRIVSGETQTVTLTGLASFKDHYVAVVPVDALGHFEPVVTYSAAYVLSPEAVSREVSLHIGGGEPTPPYAQVVSRAVSIVTPDAAVPAPVTGLESGFAVETSLSEFGAVVMDWSSYNEVVQDDVVRYRIYVGPAFFSDVTGMQPFAFAPAGTPHYPLMGLPGGAILHFAVVAEDALGHFNPTVRSFSAKVSISGVGEVANLSVQSGLNSLTYTWERPQDAGTFLSSYHVYFAGATVPVVLAADVTTWQATGLNAATGYPLRITTVDSFGNESAGLSIFAATFVPNPTNVGLTMVGPNVVLFWDEVVPVALVKYYAIYQRATPLNNVSGLVPITTSNGTSLNLGPLAAILNQYFAVATVNISDGGDPHVTSVLANKQTQTIAFPPLTVGPLAIPLAATASSGLPVHFSASPALVATVDGSTLLVEQGGTVVVTARQDGNQTYWPTETSQTLRPPPVIQSLTADGVEIVDGLVLSRAAVELQVVARDVDGIAMAEFFGRQTGGAWVLLATDNVAADGLKATLPVATLPGGAYEGRVVATTPTGYAAERSHTVILSPPPPPDTAGPTLTALTFNGSALAPGSTIMRAGTLAITASDRSGVSRVEFWIDTRLIGSDSNGADGYTALLEVVTLTDGQHTLTVRAYDSLNNITSQDTLFIVALAPPAAPTITAPVHGVLTNKAPITVSGTADKLTRVTLYNNGSAVAGPLDVDVNGRFSLPITLTEGLNHLQASASNSAGASPLSNSVHVTLDSSIPAAPLGLNASAQAGGKIRFTWNRSLESNVAGYHLYRSTQAFTTIAAAVRANSSLIPATTTLYDDLPTVDGTYYYRVVAVNQFGTPSDPSNQVSALSDSTAPKALAILYMPTGKFDASSGRMAVGRVNVTVQLSEPLLAAPFLSIVPNNGTPVAIDLTKRTDTEYVGAFEITPGTPSGTAFAVFSARDLVGNRGTDIVTGASISIDAQGPAVTNIVVTPTPPIKNNSVTPAAVTATFTLNEVTKPGTVPQFNFVLSSNFANHLPMTNLTQPSPLTWAGQFTLPASAGTPQAENLLFTYRGLDDLDNVSTTITAVNAFQVYQGTLPPLETPRDFAAVAQPAGKVKLSWHAVTGATAYQLYRQAPGESSLTEYQRVPGATAYLDSTSIDGLYHYAIASIRQANEQEAFSPQSEVLQVATDSMAPSAPQHLALELVGAGIQATWTAPPEGAASYNVYRASAATITGVQGFTPLQTGIAQLSALDPHPSHTEHTYAVTALDAAGNESPPSPSQYLDFDLLPVSDLTVVQSEANPPLLTWTQTGSSVVGYDVYLGPEATRTKLNPTPLTAHSFTDSGYANDERRYTVVAFDTNHVEIGHAITLPKLTVQLVAGTPLKRGVMNRLSYQVANLGASTVVNAVVKARVGTHETSSAPFSMNQGEIQLVSVVVGGFADLANPSTVTSTVEITPNPGETVRIVRSQLVEVQDGALVLSITPENLTRGASGTVRFTLENTSETDIEILTATEAGTHPSSDMRYTVLDKDGNVLAAQSFQQSLGAHMLTLSSGETVAKLAPAASFTSEATELFIPSAAPNEITVQLDIDHVYYQLGEPTAISIQGLSTRRAASLAETPYFAVVDTIAPESSFGDQDIVITGHAVLRATQQPLPNAPLKLIFRVSGFERRVDLHTDGAGHFTYTFHPTATDGGVYVVSALHPEMFERPAQGQFIISSLKLEYTSYRLTTPRNTPFTINVGVQAGEGTQASDVRFVYHAADQPGSTFPAGVAVTPSTPITLGSKQSGNLAVTITGGNAATQTGTLILTVLADEHGTAPVGSLRVDYNFTEAHPALFASPSFVETGLARGGNETEQVTLENRGLAEALGVSATILNTDGTPAPTWVYLVSTANLGTLAIGDKRTLDMAFAPPASVNDGIYSFLLRIAAANAPGGDTPIYVSITQSGIGNVLLKASDIYTATLDAQGNRIPGLANARITVQNEQVVSVTRTLTTDSQGEALFTDLPAGRYRLRASASNHQDAGGHLTVKPGITVTQDIFLDYNLVTVEWSVKETTIQDKFEIVLTATFETNVPAPVIVLEPSSVTLPTMQPGDVFYGELTLTNYGLIRADHVRFTPPANDAFFRFDFFAQVPASLQAKERITLPYRVVSLSSVDQPSASGGGCGGQRGAIVVADFVCANGTVSQIGSHTVWFDNTEVTGSCGFISPRGGSGSGSINPHYVSLPGAACIPGLPCNGGNGPGGQ